MAIFVCVLCGTSAEVVLEHAVLVPEGFDLMSCKEHFFGGNLIYKGDPQIFVGRFLLPPKGHFFWLILSCKM